MVLYDNAKHQCALYEIKHSSFSYSNQLKHLTDERKCQLIEHYYGPIQSKNVIYKGITKMFEGIQYINAEDYLCEKYPTNPLK